MTKIPEPATALPWAMDYDGRPGADWRNIHIWQASNSDIRIAFMSIGDDTEANAIFLINACNAFPALVEALEPFAALLKPHHRDLPDEQPIFGIEGTNVTAGDLRRARATLQSIGESDG